jgi:hypothetical protein
MCVFPLLFCDCSCEEESQPVTAVLNRGHQGFFQNFSFGSTNILHNIYLYTHCLYRTMIWCVKDDELG